MQDTRPWSAWYDALDLPAVTIHEDLLAMAAAAIAQGPERVALEYFDARIDYGQLDRLSKGLAVYLAEHGVSRGDRVAMYLQTSPHFVLGALGIWRAGAVLVTMNPMYRAGEVTHLLTDSGTVGLVSSQRGYREVIAEVRASAPDLRLVLTTSEADLLTEMGARPDRRVFSDLTEAPVSGTDDLLTVARSAADATWSSPPLGPEDLAVLCYTSGTSGPAKGAMLTHGNLAHAVARNAQWLGTGPGSCLYAAAPLFHVVGLVLELLHMLQTGGRLVLPFRFVPDVALEQFRGYRPHFFVAPPTAYNALMAAPGADPDHFSSFNRMFAGGAMLPPQVVAQFQERFGRYINNGYGLTETCGACVFAIPNRPARVDPATQAMSNGVPLPGTEVRIVDPAGAAVRTGERGEIQVRGPVVTSGYWQQPEETAKAVRDGWLATGDVGFFDDEGVLYCADRIKDLIVASGFKVWPGEVEQILYDQGSVRDAAVIGVPDPYRGETVKAFVTLRPGATTTPEELIAWCRDHLAAYKAPREVVIRPELPTTTSGKILRRELR